MSRSNTLSMYRTIIGFEDGYHYVQYARTKIVRWNDAEVILNSDGWRTVTTKRKMNQAALQFDLRFGVYQEKGDWFVFRRGPAGEFLYGQDREFEDGLTITR